MPYRTANPIAEEPHRWENQFVALKEDVVARGVVFPKSTIFKVTPRQRWIDRSFMTLCNYYGTIKPTDQLYMHGGVPLPTKALRLLKTLPKPSNFIFLGHHTLVPTRSIISADQITPNEILTMVDNKHVVLKLKDCEVYNFNEISDTNAGRPINSGSYEVLEDEIDWRDMEYSGSHTISSQPHTSNPFDDLIRDLDGRRPTTARLRIR